MLGVIIKETMSGWIRFDKFSPHSSPTEKDIETSIQYPFQINIRAFCNKLRYPFCFDFTGKALFPGLPLPHALTENDTHPEVSGKMGISHSGVSYKFKLTLPNIGPLTFEGKKVYANGTLSWKKYRTSLITLPLTVKLNGKSIGSAELKYREPLYAFPEDKKNKALFKST